MNFVMTVYYFKKLFAVYGFLLLCEFKPTGIKNVGFPQILVGTSYCRKPMDSFQMYMKIYYMHMHAAESHILFCINSPN